MGAAVSRGTRRRPRIGVALGTDAIIGIVEGSTQSATVAVDWPANGESAAPALATAFADLAGRLQSATGHPLNHARVRVALLPPLCDVRLVPLPPLRLREAEAVIRRDAARHFVGGSAARVVAVLPAAGPAGAPGASGTAPVLAAAAPVATLEAVRSAAATMGWTVDAFVPAHGAWLAELQSGGRPVSRTRLVLAVLDDAVHLLRIDGDETITVRRVPIDLADEVVSAAGPAPGTFHFLGSGGRSERIGRALAAAGWTSSNTARTDSAEESAARNAGRSRLELVPPSLIAERWRRSRSAAGRLAIAAAVLLAIAAATEMWGVRRELDAVRRERAAIRAEVAPLIEARDSISLLNDRTLAIRELEENTPRWTRALFDLALLLPADAHLTAMRTRGDTLVIEASGARAGDAIQALRRAGSLTDVRLEGLVERDLEEGSTATERFRLSARLTQPLGTAKPSITKAAGSEPGARDGRRVP